MSVKQSQRLGDDNLQRIAILRALQLGDLMCAVPAFRALRAACPQAEITLIGLPWSRGFVERFKEYLDNFIELPGFPGFPEVPFQASRFPSFLAEVQSLNFDLALQMQGSGGIANSLIELFGAHRSAGFFLQGQYCPDEQRYLLYPDHLPEVWRHLRLMEFLGASLRGDQLEFPLCEQDWRELKKVEETYSLQPGAYACVHPGSRALDRRWPPDRFAAVADWLAQQGMQVVLTGTEEEASLASEVAAKANDPLVNLAGLTSLGCLAALVSQARVVVCNDTGISHVAAAVRTPSVVLFSNSSPLRWAPLNSKLHHVIPWAMDAGPQQVSAEVEKLLREERVYA